MTDLITGLPIAGALVRTSDGFARTTDAAGFYSMTLPPGTYEVTASASGFLSSAVAGVSVVDGGTTTQAFALCPTACLGHDLAVVKLKASKEVIVTSAVTKPVLVHIQNRSDHSEAVDLSQLGDGITFGLVRLSVSVVDDDGEACQPAIVTLDAARNAKTFARGPRVLKPRQKLTIFYRVTYDCTNALKKDKTDITRGDYSHVATVYHSVLNGIPDFHPADDACPHPALPGLRDPNPPPRGVKDSGCGARKADKTFGDPILTDAVRKP